jgi:hypothetical protein
MQFPVSSLQLRVITLEILEDLPATKTRNNQLLDKVRMPICLNGSFRTFGLESRFLVLGF